MTVRRAAGGYGKRGRARRTRAAPRPIAANCNDANEPPTLLLLTLSTEIDRQHRDMDNKFLLYL